MEKLVYFLYNFIVFQVRDVYQYKTFEHKNHFINIIILRDIIISIYTYNIFKITSLSIIFLGFKLF